MSEERRCLVIDEQPAVRLGVRGLLANRYEVEEASDGQDALDLISSIGDFDVAIVELVLAASGPDAAARHPGDPRPAPSPPGARDRRPRRPPRAPRRQRGDRGRRDGLRRQELADDRARPRGRRRRRGRDLRRPGRAQRRPARADPPPAPDPPALRRRPLDRDRGPRAGPEHRDGPHAHQGTPRPPRGPRPHPRRGHRAPVSAYRVTQTLDRGAERGRATASRGPLRSGPPGLGPPRRSCGRRCAGACGPC